jgi:hypothetical protein
MPGCCLPQVVQRRLPQRFFRGSITRPTDALCMLRSLGYPRTTQHSVPAASTLCRVGLITYRVPIRSFSVPWTLSLPPGLAWRTLPKLIFIFWGSKSLANFGMCLLVKTLCCRYPASITNPRNLTLDPPMGTGTNAGITIIHLPMFIMIWGGGYISISTPATGK